MFVNKVSNDTKINFTKSNKKIRRSKDQRYALLSIGCKDKQFKTTDNEKLFIIKNPKTGFDATVYGDLNNDEITIAYRATSNQAGVISDMQMVKGEIPFQYYDAIKLYGQIKNLFPDYKIKVTGHSLGGSLAELVASTDKDAQAITFDAFGVKPIIDRDDNSLQDNGNCRNYVTQDSLVSNVTPHVGKTNTIVPNRLPLTIFPAEDIKNRHSMNNFNNLGESKYSSEITEEPKRQIRAKLLILPVGDYLDKHPELYKIIPPIFFDKTPEIDYIA